MVKKYMREDFERMTSEGKSPKQIAAIYGVKPGAIYMAARRMGFYFHRGRGRPEKPRPAQNKYYVSRKMGGLTVEQAAELAGVTTQTIRNWEMGRTTPKNG